jgi:hypothetical protein
MTKDEAEIRSIISGHAKAHYAKNADLLFGHSAQDFQSFDLAPPLQHKVDVAQARRDTEGWFATWKGPIGW